MPQVDYQLELRQLNVNIAAKTVCEKLQLEIESGQFWAILGVNGVGKTTLMHTLLNLRTANRGGVYINRRPVRDLDNKSLARHMGLMQQAYEYNFPCSVLEAALIGRHPHIDNWQWESAQDLQITREALAKTGLLAMQHRQVNTLSGGEKRRLNLAMLLTQDPHFYLLDEPTNHLDLKAQHDILALLEKLFRGTDYTLTRTGIMVIHDPNLAVRYCTHALLLLGEGKWIAGPCKSVLNAENLSRVFGLGIKAIKKGQDMYYIPAQ